ncbi:MAG: nuclear transport factor 2 family protein [Gemmatimonadota bacterium]|nr:nuclear transport factor 2 family protein [Gemmatimonadota bacterium]
MASVPYLIAAAIIASGLSGCERRNDGTPNNSSESVRSSIQAEIDLSLDATRRKDIETFIDGFTPDFKIITPNGSRITRDTLRTNALRDWSIPATRDLWMRIDSVGAAGGDTAVVYTSQRWDRLMLQRNGTTRDTVVTTQKHREVWRRTQGRWRRTEVKELGGTVEVNGKPFTQ